MSSLNIVNNFVTSLLALQQDGKQSISSPTNWLKEQPLLEVPTETDEIVDELSKTLLKSTEGNTVTRWHFFIGSPGNGKSAAIGKLCRNLITSCSCQIIDENNDPIEKLNPTAIPYALHVFERDYRFASAMIVQDASVVRKPFAPNVDPSGELLKTLKEAWEKGIGLVVCTNRGVIEKAYQEYYLNREYSTKDWFKVLKIMVENSNSILKDKPTNKLTFDARKPVFVEARITYSYLDSRSLLLGSDIFLNLINKSTDENSWTSCSKCEIINLCPFKANRDWLTDNAARTSFINILRRAEVLSGQIIVFREALAFLSMLLSGCPGDYASLHPCDWVRAKVEDKDFFALAMRRIYMSVFASSSWYGFEEDQYLRLRQHEALAILRKLIDDSSETAKMLDHAITHLPPSTDVGVGRLTGKDGILCDLDPWRECLPPDFLECWDGDFAIIAANGHRLFTDLEKRCIAAWVFLQEIIESTASHESAQCHWALNRWASNFLIHFGGLLEGRTCWAKELNDFLQIVGTLLKNPDDRAMEDMRGLRGLDLQLEKLIAARAGGNAEQDSIPLSESVILSGQWVADKLRPKINSSVRQSNLSILVEFQGTEVATLNARTFLWLSRHLHSHLNTSCIPLDLLTGIMDARIRAAANGRSAYAFSNDDIDLTISTGVKKTYTIARFGGVTDVK